MKSSVGKMNTSGHFRHLEWECKSRLRLVTVCKMILISIFLSTGNLAVCQGADFMERVEIPSSFNPLGSGARALGMGGAFIAVADDATSASWNPGGLIQVEKPEVSVVASGFHRTEDNAFGAHPEANGEQTADETDLNYFSATYPYAMGSRNVAFSVNYQHLYDLTRNWSFPLHTESASFSRRQQIEYTQEGSLSAIGFAGCIQMYRGLYFGMTLNIWNDGLTENEWEQKTYQRGTGTVGGYDANFWMESSERFTLSGVNANFGLLWRPIEKLTVGAVLKTPFDAHMTYEHSEQSGIRFPQAPASDQDNPPFTQVEHAHLKMPLSFGVGVACRFTDEFTVSLDIYRTNWDDFEYEDAKGKKTSPISGKNIDESDVDPTHQARMGMEYLFVRETFVVPIRGGVFYDPAPAEGSPDDYWGFAVGSGIGFGRFVFDMAYQFRFGNGVGGSFMENLGLSQDVREHTVYSSLIVHF